MNEIGGATLLPLARDRGIAGRLTAPLPLIARGLADSTRVVAVRLSPWPIRSRGTERRAMTLGARNYIWSPTQKVLDSNPPRDYSPQPRRG
jgi:hypothetical protein